MLVPATILILVLALLIIETLVIRRKVNALDIRVHVNGTRGKSTVTRYVAAGLRASGISTWGKITGVVPSIIETDGTLKTINRRGGARVQEQFKIIRLAVQNRVEHMVLECMSIRPELQILESRVFRPHVYVLTNVFDDHRESLGDDFDTQARAICSAIPADSLVVTSPGKHLPILKDTINDADSRIFVAGDLTDDLIRRLPVGTHAANVSLALTVCDACAVSKDRALEAILSEAGREATQISEATDHNVLFADGFAVNDVPSAESFIDYWRDRYSQAESLVVIFNSRADRPLRSEAFARYLPTRNDIGRIIVTGTHAPYMHRALTKAGFPESRISCWSSDQLKNAGQELAKLGVGRNHLVVGLGNYAGDAHVVAASFKGEVSHAV